jgi:hypothetical protein
MRLRSGATVEESSLFSKSKFRGELYPSWTTSAEEAIADTHFSCGDNGIGSATHFPAVADAETAFYLQEQKVGACVYCWRLSVKGWSERSTLPIDRLIGS